MFKKLIRKKCNSIIKMSIVSAIVMITLPILLIVLPLVTNMNYKILFVVIGVLMLLTVIKKMVPFFKTVYYRFNPEKYPSYKALVKKGINLDDYDHEITDNEIISNLNKNNPIIMTDNFVFGFSLADFFFVLKDEIVWAYTYGANGLVLYDMDKELHGALFPTVDGNEEMLEVIKNEMPYLRFGLEGNYVDDFTNHYDEVIEKAREGKREFLADPEGFRAVIKAQEEAAKAEKERLEQERLEEERKYLKNQEGQSDNIDEVEVVDSNDSDNLDHAEEVEIVEADDTASENKEPEEK